MVAVSGLSERDRRLVQVVAAFGQASTLQLHELVFHGLNRTVVYRALERLVRDKILIRLPHRLNLDRPGTMPHVYAMKSDRRRALDYHALMMLDVYVAVRGLERDGLLRLTEWDTECFEQYGSAVLRPDIFLRMEQTRSDGRMVNAPYWIEVDRMTEHRPHMMAKFRAYVQAHRLADSWPVARVLFVVINQDRVEQMRKWLRYIPEDDRQLFNVVTVEDFIQHLATWHKSQ